MDEEKLKGLLVKLLPQPVSSGAEMIAGDPRQPEVVVRLSDKGLLIAPYRAEWQGPAKLRVVVSDADIVSWSDLPDNDEQLRIYLSQKIEAARSTRKATYRTCTLCNKTKAPEWMHDESTCQTCAESNKGVVY